MAENPSSLMKGSISIAAAPGSASSASFSSSHLPLHLHSQPPQQQHFQPQQNHHHQLLTGRELSSSTSLISNVSSSSSSTGVTSSIPNGLAQGGGGGGASGQHALTSTICIVNSSNQTAPTSTSTAQHNGQLEHLPLKIVPMYSSSNGAPNNGGGIVIKCQPRAPAPPNFVSAGSASSTASANGLPETHCI